MPSGAAVDESDEGAHPAGMSTRLGQERPDVGRAAAMGQAGARRGRPKWTINPMPSGSGSDQRRIFGTTADAADEGLQLSEH
jgi:hypothetical protein